MKNSKELEDIMRYATGTEAYHRFNIGPAEILITDGVVMFIENADAFWFVSDFMSYIPEMFKKAPDEYFFAVKLVSSKGKAQMVITDGNAKTLIIKNYSYTDCPDGEWKFFYDKDSNVMLYHTEY